VGFELAVPSIAAVVIGEVEDETDGLHWLDRCRLHVAFHGTGKSRQ
jgi:hypothetical protein